MAEPVIKVEDLSKAYQIGQIGSRTLSRDVDRFWQTKILGKEDPFLKIGETNDRSIKGDSNIVWSLKDIDFEVNQGDALGIIGKNGAGKSTLLKLLSRVTSPTTGQIKVKGRIASLLEVGTGFHPELSGRENIYLNGAILGMRKKEITRKLEEIIDFSGVERYVDTPVKRYSSGMYVRLAFAVAAHLESEILIVDEVLAVGDAEFQKKCLGKMGDISKGEGRTLLFVSHNMAAVKSLCNRGLFLENGMISYNGNIDKTIDNYLRNNLSSMSNGSSIDFAMNEAQVAISNVAINTTDEHGIVQPSNSILMGNPIVVKIQVSTHRLLKNIKASIIISTMSGIRVAAIRSHEISDIVYESDSNFEFSSHISGLNLMEGEYSVTIALAAEGETIDIKEDCISFSIVANDIYQTGKIPKGNFLIFSNAQWELKAK